MNKVSKDYSLKTNKMSWDYDLDTQRAQVSSVHRIVVPNRYQHVSQHGVGHAFHTQQGCLLKLLSRRVVLFVSAVAECDLTQLCEFQCSCLY
jgi:hypothetical protein